MPARVANGLEHRRAAVRSTDPNEATVNNAPVVRKFVCRAHDRELADFSTYAKYMTCSTALFDQRDRHTALGTLLGVDPGRLFERNA